MKKVMKFSIYFLLGILLLASCKDEEVLNENYPTRDQLIRNVHDLVLYGEGAYYSYWLNTHSTNINITASVMSDQFTASWGNFGWIYASNEPRIPWDNLKTADNDRVSEDFYFGTYATIRQVNNFLRRIVVDKFDIGSDKIRLLALNYFVQGICYGNLALVFDSAYVVKEDTLFPEKVKAVEYPEVQKAAIASLEKAISYCDSASFVLSGSIFNTSNAFSNTNLQQLCHSYIARFMVLNARNKTENNQIDWNTVLVHTVKGITFDFGSNFDGLPSDGGKWYDLNLYYLNQPGWARIDCRLINLLDPSYPKHYPSDGKPPKVHYGMVDGQARSIDARLLSDFQFLSSINFLPERGYFHFSHYRYSRFDNIIVNGENALMIEYRAYENHLYYLEALANTGQVQGGIFKLNANSNPRNARGFLVDLPLTSSKFELLNAIFYEREVELLGQGFMIGFCDMRRRDLLQYGTPLHFPVPGKELETRSKPNYTYGGVDHADGVNTSNGGWAK